MFKKQQFSNIRLEINNDKRIKFDEENVRLTNHPIFKDYGFMVIPESKTPFPRNTNPVEANDLYNRLQETLDRINSTGTVLNEPFDIDVQDSILSEYNLDIYPVNHADIFNTKRKQFDKSEYTIAKQKIMSSEICAPGLSIGFNWHTEENLEQFSMERTPSILDSFLNRQRLPSQISFVNRATLLEIAEQIVHQPTTKPKKKKKQNSAK